MANGRLEWNEARVDIQNTLARLREELDQTRREVHEQDKKILALQIRVGYISAAVAFGVSLVMWVIESVGVRPK